MIITEEFGPVFFFFQKKRFVIYIGPVLKNTNIYFNFMGMRIGLIFFFPLILSFFTTQCRAGLSMRPLYNNSTLFDGVLFVRFFFSLKCIDGNCHFGILMVDIPCSVRHQSTTMFLLSYMCMCVVTDSARYIYSLSPFHRVYVESVTRRTFQVSQEGSPSESSWFILLVNLESF